MAEFIFAAEFQKRIRIGGKFGGRLAAQLRHYARIIKHRVPVQVRPENFEQRSAMPCCPSASREPVHHSGKWNAEPPPIARPARSARSSQSIRQFAKCLRARA